MDQLYHDNKITFRELADGRTILPFPGVGGGFRSCSPEHFPDVGNSQGLFRFGIDTPEMPSSMPSSNQPQKIFSFGGGLP